MSASPLSGFTGGTEGPALRSTPETPRAFDRLEMDGPVRVLMVGGKWAPGVPEEIRRKYAAPKAAKGKPETSSWNRRARTIGKWDRRKYKTRDHLIPRILEARHGGASWDRIAKELRICASSVRRLYGRGIAERSKA